MASRPPWSLAIVPRRIAVLVGPLRRKEALTGTRAYGAIARWARIAARRLRCQSPVAARRLALANCRLSRPRAAFSVGLLPPAVDGVAHVVRAVPDALDPVGVGDGDGDVEVVSWF